MNSATGGTGRLQYLDGARGIAAFAVAVLYHYVHFSGSFQPGSAGPESAPFYSVALFRYIYTGGDLAVDAFFMISGYIFSHVYSNDIAAGRVGARTFFVRRLSRLYPLHIATLLAVAMLVYTFRGLTGRFPVYADNNTLEFVLNLLFIQNGTFERGLNFNGPAWSLSIEAAAYLAFFAVAAAGMRWRWIIVMMLLGAILFIFAPLAHPQPMLVSGNLGRGLIGFFLGLAIHRAAPRLQFLLLLPFGVAWIVVHLDLVPGWPLGKVQRWSATWLVFGSLMVALRHWPVLRWPLERRFVRIAGDLSLAVYLVHFPVQVAILIVLDRLGWAIPFASPLFLLGYGIVVMAVAWMVHRYFELPAQRWLRQRLRG